MKFLTKVMMMTLVGMAAAHCPNRCSGHGECTGGHETRCACWKNWSGGDCSERRCPTGLAWADQATATDTAHGLAECSNAGLCNTQTGRCSCHEGFSGSACERMLCPESCSGHGRCVDMSYHATMKNVLFASGEVTYNNVWDAEKIYGCECDQDYHGYKCHLRHCPRGDDPMTTLQVNEKQVVMCTGTSGSFRLTFRYQTTQPINAGDSAAVVQSKIQDLTSTRAVNVVFSAGIATACTAGGHAWEVEFVEDFGNLQSMTVADYTVGITSVAVADDQSGTNTLGVGAGAKVAVGGTKEFAYCSNRGLCDTTTGICSCSDNFATSNGLGAAGTRGDCGFAAAAIVGCPGIISCSGHGVCSNYPQYTCACSEGWTGADCSERLCPNGRSWFDYPSLSDIAHAPTECSNMGNCDRTRGICQCNAGFEGAACERISCPVVEGDECSGHGRCLSMSQLAEEKLENGVSTSYTYGLSPNDPLRWDYISMYGCLCDEGFEGYDCSLRSCPVGDDPNTFYGETELQVIKCVGTSGSFAIKFREEISTTIAFDANAAAVKAALESMPFEIDAVDVTFAGGATTACSAAGTHISVSFTSELGNLPAMTVASSTTAVVTIFANGGNSGVTTSRDGTKEAQVCSGRGVCDYATGVCQCFVGWASSDGYNGEGDRGDCGYRIPAFSPQEAARLANDNDLWN